MIYKKHLGQHFLHDKKIVQRLVTFIAPSKTDHLLEFGPGTGALTTQLLLYVDTIDVIELDADVIPFLKQNTQFAQGLRIHYADMLQVDLTQFPMPLRLVGNLPYNIATPLLFHLVKDIEHIQDTHFMVQKEVADRIVAVPGNKTYGRLSVMLQYYFQVTTLCQIKPGAFNPPPQVDSAFVRFVPRRTHIIAIHSAERFSEIVRIAFSKRRKTIFNNLKNTIPNLAQHLAQLNINPQLRPEQLSVEQFVLLSNLIG